MKDTIKGIPIELISLKDLQEKKFDLEEDHKKQYQTIKKLQRAYLSGSHELVKLNDDIRAKCGRLRLKLL